MRILSAVFVSACFLVGPAVSFAAPSSSIEMKRFDLNETHSFVAEAAVDLAALADSLNSFQNVGELLKNLEQTGFANAEERVAIENFLQDRGVTPATPIEKVKFDSSTNTLRWSEISLTQVEGGDLKNSFGQIVKAESKSLNSAFGEAYLSFDRRSARARVMDLFLQEARAESTGATPAARASGSFAASIYMGLRSAKTFKKASNAR
jgi:hypothetical protein